MFGLAIDYRKIAALVAAAAVLALIIVFRIPVVAAVLPFFLALILANILDPIVLWLQRRLRLPRSVATILTLGAALAVVGYSALWILSNLYREVVELAATLPTYERTIGRLVTDMVEQVAEIFEQLPRDWLRFFRDQAGGEIDEMIRTAVDILKGLTGAFVDGIASLPALFVTGIVTMLATYFFTTDKETVDTSLLRTVPIRLRPTLAEMRDKILVDLVGFFKAQFVLFFINTALAALWLFVSGASYWMLASLVLGILDVIPVLGPGLVLMPWAAFALWQSEFSLAVSLVALFVAMFGVRQVLQAKILGDSVGIHPALMLFALWSGIVIFGVWGFIIGPIIVIFAKAIWNTGLISYGKEDEWVTDGDDPAYDAAEPPLGPPGATEGVESSRPSRPPESGAAPPKPGEASDPQIVGTNPAGEEAEDGHNPPP